MQNLYPKVAVKISVINIFISKISVFPLRCLSSSPKNPHWQAKGKKSGLHGRTKCYFSYFLATNPEVQEELFREIDEAVEANGGDQHLDYNITQTLQYLDQVWTQ